MSLYFLVSVSTMDSIRLATNNLKINLQNPSLLGSYINSPTPPLLGSANNFQRPSLLGSPANSWNVSLLQSANNSRNPAFRRSTNNSGNSSLLGRANNNDGARRHVRAKQNKKLAQGDSQDQGDDVSILTRDTPRLCTLNAMWSTIH
jgi:hypothetical protein